MSAMLNTTGLVMLALSLALLVGCGGSDSDQPAAVTTVVTQVKTVEATSSVPSNSSSAEPAADETDSGEDSFTMPNEVGKGLQEAQDHIQEVSGNPLFFTDSSDASGQGRMQILDRNWKVCSQNVSPGTTVDSETDISFATVKLDEDCP